MTLNRFIAFIGPYLNLISSSLAAWLIGRVNVLGIPGLGDTDQLATQLAALITAVLVFLATHLAQATWLKGHQIQMQGDAQVQAAAVGAPQPPLRGISGTTLSAAAGVANTGNATGSALYISQDDNTLTEMPTGGLPTDDEEAASPPPDESNTPVQPSQGGDLR